MWCIKGSWQRIRLSSWPTSLRAAGLKTVLHCGGGSFKAQFKKADASGALFAAIIIGEEEAANGSAAVKRLVGEGAGQQTVLPVAEITQYLRG